MKEMLRFFTECAHLKRLLEQDEQMILLTQSYAHITLKMLELGMVSVSDIQKLARKLLMLLSTLIQPHKYTFAEQVPSATVAAYFKAFYSNTGGNRISMFRRAQSRQRSYFRPQSSLNRQQFLLKLSILKIFEKIMDIRIDLQLSTALSNPGDLKSVMKPQWHKFCGMEYDPSKDSKARCCGSLTVTLSHCDSLSL